MEQEPDHDRALAVFIDATTAIFRRVLPLASVFKALGDDPEMASFYTSSARWQRDGYRTVVETLARKQPLRAGLSSEDATTILLVLYGIDVYRSMLEDHGWDEPKWRTWVIETVSEALFGRWAGR